MKEISYKTFSLRTHKKNWQIKRPNVCQFELTFACTLHCQHCYSDCYNRPSFLKKELNTKQVKLILDRVYNAGVIWVCFTGGDPLKREDFLEIYSYAKNKGFIITIFTNGYSMTEEIADCLKKMPPFSIEMTLNGITPETYEKISQIEGSFEKTRKGINLILERKLPLKIKTQITKENLEELPRIKKFIEGLGLEFRASPDLFARLNGDLTPCNSRVTPQKVLNLNGNKGSSGDDCQLSPKTENQKLKIEDREPKTKNSKQNNELFRCAIGGGDGINIDPYGNRFLCSLIRTPVLDLLNPEVEYAANELLPLVRGRGFSTNSKCKGCNLRELCHWCPGRALVETGDMEMPIEYYCDLTHLINKKTSVKFLKGRENGAMEQRSN